MAGLYIHIPFCSQRCVYCDFYFVTTQKSHGSFVQALCTEIEHYASEYAHLEPVDTIYFGGGTPSLLHEDELACILETIYRNYDAEGAREVTLELNPENGDIDYLRGLRSLGFNRLSIGVQSFYDNDLKFMNRAHNAAEAEIVVPNARKAGFDNITIDLIFGIPEQPDEYWAANLEKAVLLDVPHLSVYGLTVEERTVLHKQVERGTVQPVKDEKMAAQFAFTMDYLRLRGYDHYEISSYARDGYRSEHNKAYWEHKNYLGFGPSAHSFWWRSLPKPAAIRWANARNIKQYEALIAQRQVPVTEHEVLDLDTLANEYVMLRLRTGDGLDLDTLEERYGVDLLVEKLDELAWLETEGLIETIRRGKVKLTDKGKGVADAVTSKLLPDEAPF